MCVVHIWLLLIGGKSGGGFDGGNNHYKGDWVMIVI